MQAAGSPEGSARAPTARLGHSSPGTGCLQVASASVLVDLAGGDWGLVTPGLLEYFIGSGVCVPLNGPGYRGGALR